MTKTSIITLSIIYVICLYGSLSVGYEFYSPREIYLAITGHRPDWLFVLVELRLPRIILALLVGSALGISGALLQQLTRNPMSSPDILGLNSAAALAVVLLLLVVPSAGASLLTIAAILGVLMACIIIGLLARAPQFNNSMLALPLLGVVLSMLFAAITQAILTMSEATMEQALFWLSGSIVDRGFDSILNGLPPWAAGIFCTLWILPQLKILLLDTDHAKSLGVNVQRLSKYILLAVILLSASAVIFAGPIGFVGLIIPHIARLLSPRSPVKMVLLSAWLGGLLMLIADIIARLAAYPEETPVGVITAIIGAPVLLFFVLKMTRRTR